MTQTAAQQRGRKAKIGNHGHNGLPYLLMGAWGILCVVLLVLLPTAQTGAANGLETGKRLEFTVPGAPWTLSLPENDFVVRQKQIKPDGSAGYFYLTDEERLLNVSFFIEPAIKCQDSKSCRDMVWKAGNPAWKNIKNVSLSEIGEVSTFEFLIPSFQGQPIQQQNMYAQFVVDGFWVDFHISKVLYKPEERKLFEELVKSIKFEPKEKKASG
jgi:hypothetical protein